MKNLKYIMATLMVALIVAVVLVGCKKEKETMEQPASKGMLCFNSAEEFAETYKKVVAMTEEERRVWEQQRL